MWLTGRKFTRICAIRQRMPKDKGNQDIAITYFQSTAKEFLRQRSHFNPSGQAENESGPQAVDDLGGASSLVRALNQILVDCLSQIAAQHVLQCLRATCFFSRIVEASHDQSEVGSQARIIVDALDSDFGQEVLRCVLVARESVGKASPQGLPALFHVSETNLLNA